MRRRPPSVPDAADDAADRRLAIRRDREIWRFDHSWEGLTFPHPDDMMRKFRADVFGRPERSPRLSEQTAVLMGVGGRWLVKSAPLLAAAKINNGLAARMRRDESAPISGGARRTRRHRAFLDRVEHLVVGNATPDPTPRPFDHRAPVTLRDYHQALTIVDEPAAARHWNEDWWFVRERLAGCNPVSIELVRDATLLERVPLTEAQFAASSPGDSLLGAISDQRVFIVDMAMLDGLEAGDSFGWRKYLYAPIAVFALRPDRSELVPIAIQCGQVPGPDTPVITPHDGVAWTMAKVTFASAESNYHGIAEHGAFCHIVIGAMAIALRRSLAPWHPVRVLLEPNIEHTIPIALATKNLFEPGGRTPTLQAVTPDACAELVRRAWASFDWVEQSGRSHFARRGVLDADALPDYPMRDDIDPYDDAIRRFVHAYVRLYYADDAAVRDDVEIQAWRDEMVSPHGGDQPSTPPLGTVDALADFVADIIWRASPYHVTINYSIEEAMGFVPNMPTATYGPAPLLGHDYTDDDVLALLPPVENCDGIIDDVVHVARLRLNRLGEYRSGHFVDGRVAPLVTRFQSDLSEIGTVIDERNRTRRAPYPFLHPSLVTASIHI